MPTNRDYWNHNTAYHSWLIDIAAQHRGDVLDVGCGDGLLAQRLAPVSRSVTAYRPRPRRDTTCHRPAGRTQHVTLSRRAFDAYRARPTVRPHHVRREPHHMDLRPLW